MLKELKFLLPAIGDNVARRNLMFLHIKKTGQKLVLTAANFFIVKRVTLIVKNYFPDDFKDGEYLIEGRILEKAVRVMKKKSAVSFEEKGIYVDGTCYDYDKSDQTYPNLDHLFDRPKYSEKADVTLLGLNANLLISVLKNSPNSDRQQANVVKFLFEKNATAYENYTGPVLLKFWDHDNFEAVIMSVHKMNW